VVHSGLGQHGVVLNFGLPAIRDKNLIIIAEYVLLHGQHLL
jgi:hypothetical protein